MGREMTEVLKDALEGIVLAGRAVLAGESAYGDGIPARLREQGFTEIAIHAFLVRNEKRHHGG